MGTLRDKPGLRRFLRRTPPGLLRVDKAAIAPEGGLLLTRVAETTVGDTWRIIRHELDRMHLVTLARIKPR
jgi:hypothetical protein